MGYSLLSYPAETRRPTWPLIADDLFRVAHDDWGKNRLHPDVVGIGLGAALLGELLITGYVSIRDDLLIPVQYTDPIDELAAAVLHHILTEPRPLGVRTWLRYLATSGLTGGPIYEHVARRLERGGHVQAEKRGLLRRKVRYVPRDFNTAAWPWARISAHLRRHENLDAADTILGGLILATDLHRHVLVGERSQIEPPLRSAIAVETPAVGDLLRHAEAAAGNTVITG